MLLKDVPASPAYLVFHDCFDKGAMEVWPIDSIAEANLLATVKNELIDQSGYDDAGFYKAYIVLPRKRVYKYHASLT